MSSKIQYLPGPSCQIPGLADILEKHFGLRADGSFVEVGAYDGKTCSNTAFLADLGWRGLYVEPVPAYAHACAVRHQSNPGVLVANCAIGEREERIVLHVGGVLTTADEPTLQAYRQIDWAKSFHAGQTIEVLQVPLETLLLRVQFPARFDLLVVDVEGSEEKVFNSFDLNKQRPRMMIVEIEDTHPSFQQFPLLTARARALREKIHAAGYGEIFRDPINTIFWDQTEG